MTKISQYSTDVNITGNDKWIGSDAQNFLITKNFTPNNLANYFNENNVIDIGTSIRYRYQTLDPGEAREQGTISFETEIGPQVNFSAITTFLIAKNTLKGNTVSQYLDFLVDSKVLLSKASNINVFGYYKITSIEPWIPNTDFFVVEVDFLAGNGFIYEDLDYLVSLVDKAQDSTTPNLQEVTDEGNTTTNNIQLIDAAEVIFGAGGGILLDNGSRLREGTIDAGLGGSKGIAQICAVGYELKWEAGRLYVMNGNGNAIRSSLYNFNIAPTINDDDTKAYYVGSLWSLDNGDVYECTDSTTGAAIWELVNTGTMPTLQQVTDEGATTTNAIETGNIIATDVNGGEPVLKLNYDTNNTNTIAVFSDANTGFSHNIDNSILTANRYIALPDASGTIALTSDITTPTLQQVTDEGADSYGNSINLKNTSISDSLIEFNVDDFFEPYIKVENLGAGSAGHFTKTGSSTIEFDGAGDYNTVLEAGDGLNNTVTLPSGTGTLALTSDITTPTWQETLDINFGVSNIVTTPFYYDDGVIKNSNDVFGVRTEQLTGDLLFTSVIPGQIVVANGNSGKSISIDYDYGIQFYKLIGSVGKSIYIKADNVTNNNVIFQLPNKATGDYTLATLTDIPSSVTSVTATSPITSSGGTTPDISTSMATNKLIGRSTAGVGVMEEITVGTGLTLSGGTLNASATGGGIPHATASGTDTYTATITGVTSYADGDAYLIRFTNGNTSGATLNINSLGAITLYRNNDGVLIGGDIISGGEMICIYNSTTNGFQCIGTAPNSLFSYVTNADSVTLTKGMPVYAFGGTGDRMTVKRAYNTGDSTSAQTVGLVLSTSIATNQKGLIMMQGLLDGLSILPTSTWADGDTVYLGATAGTITNIKPYAPNHLVYLGVVTTSSNGAAGRMYVRVQNGYELDELHNVQAQSPSLKDTLWYDNTVSPAQWKTASISTVLGFTPENVANKENTTLDTSTTKYPTNRLTKEYADAKVTDAITNGVTTVAPSQNAVFDALALKQNALSFTPYKFIQTSQTAHTGTTAETILATATIAGGTFNSSDVMKVLLGINKTGTNGAYTIRLRINTSNTLSGATQIAIFTASSTTVQYAYITRNFSLNGGNLYGYAFATSNVTDIINVGGTLSSTTYNTANTLYLFFTVALVNSADSITPNLCNITN